MEDDMEDRIGAVAEYLIGEFDDCLYDGWEIRHRPVPGYEFSLTDDFGNCYSVHVSKDFLHQHAPESIGLVLDAFKVEIAMRGSVNGIAYVARRGVVDDED